MEGVQRGRLRQPGDSGAAAVEFALVMPVVLLLVLGMIEFSFMMRDQLAITNLARDASRVASTNPRVGNVEGHWGEPGSRKPGGGGFVSASAQPSFAFLASEQVKDRGSALDKDSIADMWIYLANSAGYPTLSGDWKTDPNRSFGSRADFATYCPPATCVRYTWLDNVDGFRFDGRSTWDPLSVNACPRWTSPDGQAVGVFLRIERSRLVPGFFPGANTMSEHTVVKFEPMRPTNCR